VDPPSPLAVAPASTPLGAGGASTCVRTASGQLRCWGENGTGSLGIGDDTVTASATPVTPTGLSSVAAIASGATGHCALRTDGKVLCWGEMPANFSGQLFDAIPFLNAMEMDGLEAVARIAVGHLFRCAVTVAGALRCWGRGAEGQLGLGTTAASDLPTTVTALPEVTSVAASMGGSFACATTRAGAVHCWGANDHQQIGGADANVLSPRLVDGFGGPVVEVALGAAHGCARLASGEVKCWGSNASGQLGDGTTTSASAPVSARSLTDVAGLCAGRAHSCAVRTEGSVLCWGDDASGQAGSASAQSQPMLVLPADFRARTVACGLSHTCAWGDGGRVKCWGANDQGQLGPKSATF
jgi:alpha-tubulin suppressor-like RCC1 family protein